MTRSPFRTAAPFLAALAIAAFPAAADSLATTDAFLPVVHVVGATGVYHTDVSIFNPSDQTADVILYFEAADADGTHAPAIRFQNGLGSRETATLEDILLNNFAVSSGYGQLEVASNVPVIVTSNTYNIAGKAPGTFGQFSPGQPERNSVGFGNTNDYDLYVAGIVNDGDHRVNAVVMNPSKYTLNATMELVDGTGQIWGHVTATAPPYSMHQMNDIFGAIFGSLNPPSDNAWRLNFYVNTNTGATLLAYVTITDTRSGDPYLVPASAQVVNVPAKRPAPDGAVRLPTPHAPPVVRPAAARPVTIPVETSGRPAE